MLLFNCICLEQPKWPLHGPMHDQDDEIWFSCKSQLGMEKHKTDHPRDLAREVSIFGCCLFG